ncbi:MAG: type VI secretion system contractile sheath domain-containing protein [Phycisphaerales bacterium]
MSQQQPSGTPGEIRAEFTFSQPKGEPIPTRATAMRIVVVGDFTGRESRGVDTGAIGRARSFDVDTLEGLPGRMGVEISLSREGDTALAVPIGTIDDLHPDHLLARVPVFHELLGVRRRLADPATFADAAAEVKAWSAAPAPDSATSQSAPAPSSGGNLASLLGMRDAPAGDGATNGRRRSPADALIRSLVRPHIVDDPDPRQESMVAEVDRGLATQLRAVLHDPMFQRVEANWRSAWELATMIETDQGVGLSIVDASKRELLADLGSAGDPDASALGRALAEMGAGGEDAWTLVVGLFSFGPTRADAEGLLRIAQCVRRVGGSVVCAGEPGLVGCPAFEGTPNPGSWSAPGDEDGAWAALRRRPEAGHICLTAPRTLVRLPYGASTDPIDTMPFEEAEGGPLDHGDYLWSEGSPLVARVLASLFVEHERFVFPPGIATIDGLPAHSWKDADGEPEMKPCAEAWLTEQAMRKIESCGLTPLASVRRLDAVQVQPPRAFAEGASRLAGPWS